MADCVIKSNESFEFTYSATQQEEVERIRNKYLNIKKKEIQPMEKKNFITLVLDTVLIPMCVGLKDSKKDNQ